MIKLYAECPICGYKLCKGAAGSDVDILCHRCGRLVRIIVTENGAKNEYNRSIKKNKRQFLIFSPFICPMSDFFEHGAFFCITGPKDFRLHHRIYFLKLKVNSNHSLATDKQFELYFLWCNIRARGGLPPREAKQLLSLTFGSIDQRSIQLS